LVLGEKTIGSEFARRKPLFRLIKKGQLEPNVIRLYVNIILNVEPKQCFVANLL
jgi:hypothetical protein